MSGSGLVSSRRMTSPNGRGGPGLSWPWLMTCLFTTSAAGRLPGNGVDAEKLLDENARRFAAKWGVPGTKRQRVALRPWKGPLEFTQRQSKVSLKEQKRISRKAAKPQRDRRILREGRW